MSSQPFTTNFFNVAVDTTPVQILIRNKKRTGYTICNRTASTVYVGNSSAIGATGTNSVRLLQNEIITVLESENDDPPRELFAVATVASIVEVIESTRL